MVMTNNPTETFRTNLIISIHHLKSMFYNLIARDIKIMKPLQDLEVTEKESATFVCEINHDEVEAQWHKGDTKLKPGDNIKIRQESKFS